MTLIFPRFVSSKKGIFQNDQKPSLNLNYKIPVLDILTKKREIDFLYLEFDKIDPYIQKKETFKMSDNILYL